MTKFLICNITHYPLQTLTITDRCVDVEPPPNRGSTFSWGCKRNSLLSGLDIYISVSNMFFPHVHILGTAELNHMFLHVALANGIGWSSWKVISQVNLSMHLASRQDTECKVYFGIIWYELHTKYMYFYFYTKILKNTTIQVSKVTHSRGLLLKW